MGLGEIGQAILALAFVLGLFGLLVLAARKFGLGGARPMMRPGQTRRLGLVEVMALDARRRLVLIRRDDTEHLVILGPDGETVVERGIAAPGDTATGAGAAGPGPSFSERLRAVAKPGEPGGEAPLSAKRDETP